MTTTTTIITVASYAVTRTLSYSLVMTSSQQYIVWTAVLLYHHLKVAARIHNRYRLNSKIISTALIQRLALYYKKSTASIFKIVGVNGRNTKRIYNRLVGRCKSFEILNCIYKKADRRILDCNTGNTSTAIISTQQSQSQGKLSLVERVHDIIVCITDKDTNKIICNDNNKTSCSKQINHQKCATIFLPRTVSFMNRRSSSRIATIKSLSFSKRLIILPCKPVLENKKTQWI